MSARGAQPNHLHSDKQAKSQILSFSVTLTISGYKVGIVEETQSVAVCSVGTC